MSPNDVQWWSLVVGLGLFVMVVVGLFVGRRTRERRGGSPVRSDSSTTPRAASSGDSATAGAPAASPTARRRPTSPPPPGEPRELASAVRSAILRSAAERIPAGWSALILSPPPHLERMTWHVHLAPVVELDLRDGRTVTVAAPAASHDWQVAGGRTVGVGEGDPDPAPGEATVAVRVTGPYLAVAVGEEGGRGPTLVARVVLLGDEELPQPRAVATDPRAVQGALREAIELTVGSRMTSPPPTVAYQLPSWRAHERTWLTIGH